MPRIIGDTIMLREYSQDDLLPMRDWVNDPEITDHLSDIFLHPQTWNDTEKFLQMVIEGKLETRFHFVIANKETSAYLGQIDLLFVDWKSRCTEMGIVIGKKDLLSKGIGTEAIKLLQYFVFDKLNLNRLQLTVHSNNPRAIKCYSKCGLIEEGRLRQKIYNNGEYSDLIYMGILREDYDMLTSNFKPDRTYSI
ncbi:MAG: family N-acetyltransferase [Firmicutes bacterium]|nr:family N-acetyltransferase [Bacillota bacterium]